MTCGTCGGNTRAKLVIVTKDITTSSQLFESDKPDIVTVLTPSLHIEVVKKEMANCLNIEYNEDEVINTITIYHTELAYVLEIRSKNEHTVHYTPIHMTEIVMSKARCTKSQNTNTYM